MLQITVMYLTATINWKTPNWETQIEIDVPSLTRQNLRVDGYHYRFAPPRNTDSGGWTGLWPNWNICQVQIWTTGRLCGPSANTSVGRNYSSDRNVIHCVVACDREGEESS